MDAPYRSMTGVVAAVALARARRCARAATGTRGDAVEVEEDVVAARPETTRANARRTRRAADMTPSGRVVERARERVDSDASKGRETREASCEGSGLERARRYGDVISIVLHARRDAGLHARARSLVIAKFLASPALGVLVIFAVSALRLARDVLLAPREHVVS